jgi:NTP pyrophosphatase (non-canonical NTP hydrolase)
MDKKTQALVLTMEECGELTQACSKVIRRNGDEKSISDLIDEAGDVLCMIELLVRLGYLREIDLDERKKLKKLKLKSWSNLYD